MTEGVREEGAQKDILIQEGKNKSGNKKTEDIRGLCPSSNTIGVNSKRTQWVEHVAGTGNKIYMASVSKEVKGLYRNIEVDDTVILK